MPTVMTFWVRGEAHSPLISTWNMLFMFFTQIQTQNKFPDFNLQHKYSKSFLSLDTTPNYANDLSLESSRKALSNSTMIAEKIKKMTMSFGPYKVTGFITFILQKFSKF